MVRDTLTSQGAYTHQIWDSYLKQECSLKDSYNPPPQVDSDLCVTFRYRRKGMTEGLVLHTVTPR